MFGIFIMLVKIGERKATKYIYSDRSSSMLFAKPHIALLVGNRILIAQCYQEILIKFVE